MLTYFRSKFFRSQQENKSLQKYVCIFMYNIKRFIFKIHIMYQIIINIFKIKDEFINKINQKHCEHIFLKVKNI